MSSETLTTCGCCESLKARTPVALDNAPGLSALAYRVGTHGQFKASLLAAISRHRELDSLTTRADDDPSIALLDGWATVLDVLSFYQERIANEGYLRTATERRSLLELARSIGYELRPGVAAGAHLAFTLDDVPQAPREAKIPLGAKVQSVPAQDEKPQTFETVEELEARAEWNAMRPRLRELKLPGFGDTYVAFQGTSTNLKPGDAILFAGAEREAEQTKENWDFRRVKTVEPVFTGNADTDYTLVTWDRPLGQIQPYGPVAAKPKGYALRQRAALFGASAPDWRLMPAKVQSQYESNREEIVPLMMQQTARTEWPAFTIRGISGSEEPVVFLDAIYPRIQAGSWLVLSQPEYAELYKVDGVTEDSRTMFTLNSKTSRVVLQGENLFAQFDEKVRQTVVFAESEELPIAELPIADTVWGQEIELDQLVTPLGRGRKIIVRGQRVHAKVTEPVLLQLSLRQKTAARQLLKSSTKDLLEVAPLARGSLLRLVRQPTIVTGGLSRWTLIHETGLIGEAEGSIEYLREDVVTCELAEVDTVRVASDGRVTLVLKEPLQNSYDRASVRLLGNVALATQGESKTEVLGSGDASQPFQSFTLKQTPLTFVSAASASGAASTLEVRANDVLWTEAPSFYELGPHDRCYVTRRADDGKVTVEFGDGLTGARPPTGVENIKAGYRVGLGLAGNLDASQLSLLMTRPLGVKEVTNPQPSTGGDDPEARDTARQNAPLTMLTLDRIVSLQDFEDFARAFAGIGKAQATWVWSGTQRVVFLTVAGADGGALIETQPPLSNLLPAIEAAREPTQPVQVGVFTPLQFRLSAKVLRADGYLKDKVYAAITSALLGKFSFDQRSFGQAVTASEVLAVMQAVEGVKAVDLDTLHLSGDAAKWNPRLPVNTAHWDDTERVILPAELLTLDAAGIELKEMKP